MIFPFSYEANLRELDCFDSGRGVYAGGHYPLLDQRVNKAKRLRKPEFPQCFGRMLNVTTSFEWPMSRSFTCRPLLWVVAQLVEHRTVTAAREGSTPFDPPNFLARNCGRGVRHLIVDQAHDGSSPFSSANFLATKRHKKHKSVLCLFAAIHFRGSDVAGNMRVFQTRLESSNLSFRSN